MVERTDWEARAANLLKAELKRRGVTYAQLVERLREIGEGSERAEQAVSGQVYCGLHDPMPSSNRLPIAQDHGILRVSGSSSSGRSITSCK
jgi:hypothetical protein